MLATLIFLMFLCDLTLDLDLVKYDLHTHSPSVPPLDIYKNLFEFVLFAALLTYPRAQHMKALCFDLSSDIDSTLDLHLKLLSMF